MQSIKHTIEVKGIKLYSFHGCLEEEAKIGGNYIVDVHLTTDFSEAAKNDDLSKTISYVAINHIVAEEMAIRSKLIEHVGQRIVDRLIKEIRNTSSLKVKVVKVCPPINGDVENASITIELTEIKNN